MINVPSTNGATSRGLEKVCPAALFEDAAAVPVDTAVTDPDPGVAVVVEELSLAHCEPVPLSPGPAPAPVFMYAAAADGIAGRESSVMFQLELYGGQVEAPPVELYPPVPDGGVLAASSDLNAA